MKKDSNKLAFYFFMGTLGFAAFLGLVLAVKSIFHLIF